MSSVVDRSIFPQRIAGVGDEDFTLTRSCNWPEDRRALRLLGGTMRLAFAGFTSALLMIGSAPAHAQQSSSAAGSPEATSADPKPTAEPKAAPGSVGISISPKTRKKLQQDLLNAVAPPRPAAATAAPAGAAGATPPVATPTGTPGAGTVSPAPPPPRPATGVALTPAATATVPRPAATVVPLP